MTLSIVAIDGVGRQTGEYASLLRTCASAMPGSRPVLLTSDSSASETGVACVEIEPLDYYGYSRFCVEQLASYVQTDHALMVQLDGFILNPKLFTPEFLAYDYVGAPWKNKRGRPIAPGREVGNGGFSLRSRRFLEASAELTWTKDWAGQRVPSKYHGNEDYFLCVLRRDELERKGVRFAPASLATRFSIQAGDRWGLSHRLGTTFGFHGKKWMRRAGRVAARNGLRYEHV